MAVRLRPQSSAWLAPTALAAQLTAQTGQIAGQGVAGLLGGIAQGVGAFTQKREQRRVEAINERRYQDSLTRQDRDFGMREKAFTLDLLQGNDRILAESETGKAAELEMALMAGEDASVLKQELEKIRSSRRAVQSNMMGLAPALKAAAAGRAAPDAGPVGPGGWPVGQSPSEKAARGEPTGDPDVFWNAKDYAESDTAQRGGAMPTPPSGPRMAKGGVPVEVPRDGFDLETPQGVAAYAKAHEELADQWDKLAEKYAGSKNPMVVARARGFMGTAAEIRMRGLGYQGMAMTKAEKAEQTRKAEDLKAQEESRMRVGAADDARTAEANKSQDAAAIASMQADLEKRGIKETLPADITTARTVYRDLVVTDPNSEMSARRKAEASKVRADNQKSLEALRQAGRKEMEDIRAKNREPAAAEKAAQAAIDNQESVVGTLMKEYDLLKKLREKGLIAEDDEDLAAAYGNFAAAKAKYIGMVSGGAPATGAPAPASTASADPMSKAEAEYNALPDAEKTPEAAARIAAKYGIK